MISEQKRTRIRRALDNDIPQIVDLLGQVLEIHAKIRPDIFNYLKEEAKRLGYEEITLNSWEGNEAANAFYKKMGLKVRSSILEYKF